MRYEARITAYDCMDKVQVTLNARDTTATPENTRDVTLNIAVTLDGRGTDDLAVWVREALLGLVQAL